MSLNTSIISSLKKAIFLSLLLFLPTLNANSNLMACGCSTSYDVYETTPFTSTNYSHIPYYTFKEQVEPEIKIDTPLQTQVQTSPQLQTSEKVVRAAIDIGSGATKLRVAEVNLKTHKIEKILINESFPVQYQEKLSKSADNTFDKEVMQTGIDAMKKSAEIAKKYNAEKVVAVATASFRKAANSQELMDRIYEETGVKVYVIDQELEGKLAYNAILAQGNFNMDDLIVWDIGGGSLQLTSLNKDGSYHIYRGEIASIHFKDIVIDDIQHKDSKVVTTPNPMTAKEIEHAGIHARDQARKVDKYFREKLLHPETEVVGVGNIFAYGVYPVVGDKTPFTQEELHNAVLSMAGKDDAQLGGGDYANVQLSNLILVLGYMQGLDINQMNVVDINNADGAMLYPEFWE